MDLTKTDTIPKPKPLLGPMPVSRSDEYFQHMPDIEKLGRMAMKAWSAKRTEFIEHFVKAKLIELGMPETATDEEAVAFALANGIRVFIGQHPKTDVEHLIITCRGEQLAAIRLAGPMDSE